MNMTTTITDNIQARKDAEEIFAFIGDKPARFWETLFALAADKLPKAPEQVDRFPPMTEQEAIHFESQSVPYGKYAFTEVGCVPPDYLLFLTEGDEWSKRLKRYVKSKRFQDRQED